MMLLSPSSSSISSPPTSPTTSSTCRSCSTCCSAPLITAGGEELLEAAGHGRLYQLCQLLSDNPALLHYVDPEDRWTPLLAATAHGSLELVEFLVGLGAKVNQRDAYDRTPLYWAAAGKNIEVLRLLLRHGAAHKVMSSEGLSPLMVAARNGFVEGVAALVAHDSSAKHLEMCGPPGKTALWLAALEGHHEIVRLLLSHDAKMSRQGAYYKCIGLKNIRGGCFTRWPQLSGMTTTTSRRWARSSPVVMYKPMMRAGGP